MELLADLRCSVDLAIHPRTCSPCCRTRRRSYNRRGRTLNNNRSMLEIEVNWCAFAFVFVHVDSTNFDYSLHRTNFITVCCCHTLASRCLVPIAMRLARRWAGRLGLKARTTPVGYHLADVIPRASRQHHNLSVLR